MRSVLMRMKRLIKENKDDEARTILQEVQADKDLYAITIFIDPFYEPEL